MPPAVEKDVIEAYNLLRWEKIVTNNEKTYASTSLNRLAGA